MTMSEVENIVADFTSDVELSVMLVDVRDIDTKIKNKNLLQTFNFQQKLL